MTPPSRRHSLTQGPIARTLVLFSLPILGSNVLQSLNVSVNSVWIGHCLSARDLRGIADGVQMIVLSLSGLIMIGLINGYGSQVTAAYGAALQLWRYIQMPALAVGSAVASMAAQNVGAGLWRRVSRVAGTGVIYNVLLTGTLVLIIYFFSRHALGLFLPHDSEALDIAEHLNRIAVWSFLLISVSFVLFGVIRSTGAMMPPLIILAIALLGVRIPFVWILRAHLVADAVWWSYPIGAAVTVTLTVVYYRFGRWRHAHMLKPVRGQGSTLGIDSPAVMTEPDSR